mgnify:CR=1 FL=1
MGSVALERKPGQRTDLGEDLDDSLARLGARLEEQEPHLGSVRLGLLPGHLPPALARDAAVGVIAGGLSFALRRGSRIVRLVIRR